MKLQESYDKHSCDECDEYTYVFKIDIGEDDEDGFPGNSIRLCKKCLLKLFKLFKLILER
jgi:hypothetical protein